MAVDGAARWPRCSEHPRLRSCSPARGYRRPRQRRHRTAVAAPAVKPAMQADISHAVEDPGLTARSATIRLRASQVAFPSSIPQHTRSAADIPGTDHPDLRATSLVCTSGAPGRRGRGIPGMSPSATARHAVAAYRLPRDGPCGCRESDHERLATVSAPGNARARRVSQAGSALALVCYGFWP
jgi:hypothetical protein